MGLRGARGDTLLFKIGIVNSGHVPVTVIHGSQSFNVVLYEMGGRSYPAADELSFTDDLIKSTIKPSETYHFGHSSRNVISRVYTRCGKVNCIGLVKIGFAEESLTHLPPNERYEESLRDYWLVSEPITLHVD